MYGEEIQKVAAGNCPKCEKIVIVFDRFGWELAQCKCGWAGGVPELRNAMLRRPSEEKAGDFY